MAMLSSTNTSLRPVISDVDDTMLANLTTSIVPFLINNLILYPMNVQNIRDMYHYTKKKLRNSRF
jgi:hypothetical protein